MEWLTQILDQNIPYWLKHVETYDLVSWEWPQEGVVLTTDDKEETTEEPGMFINTFATHKILKSQSEYQTSFNHIVHFRLWGDQFHFHFFPTSL